MCTVSIYNSDGLLVLTSNRDERKARDTVPPKVWEVEGRKLVFPRDNEAGGTWIAMEPGTGAIRCLLNGANHPHEKKGPYTMSRGKVLVSSFCANAEEFARDFNFLGIEPFTLLAIDGGAPTQMLVELIWDGEILSITKHSLHRPKLWASATLYSPEVRTKKQALFRMFVKANPSLSATELMDFHQKEVPGLSETNGFVIDRGVLATVSLTQIVRTPHDMAMYYVDLQKEAHSTYKLSFVKPNPGKLYV